MNKKITIPYGPTVLDFELPSENILLIGEPKKAAGCDVILQTNKALDNPVAAKPIEAVLRKGDKVAIISDDYTRPTPAHEILPCVLNRLNNAGIPDSDIVIVIAAGIHRKMTDLELEKKLGRNVCERIQVVQHRADEEDTLEFVGKTKAGTPIWLNREVVRADFRIGIGLVEAHPYAGFCGGPKIMMPGVAGQATIFHHHGHMAKSSKSWFGRTKDNPFWQELVEIAEIGKLNMVINVVINSKGEVTEVFAGAPVQAQEKAIEAFVRVYGVEVPEPADIVIASANPKYWYFDQSNVSMLNAATIVKNGGTRIIAAYCPEGLGPEIIRRLYLESFGRPWPSTEQYLQEMTEGLYNYEMADAPAIYKLLQAEEKSHMILVSEGINAADADQMRLDWTRNIQEAIDKAFKRNGPNAKIVVLPFGGMCYPFLSKSST